jgi:hypothetical protein
LDNKGLAIKRQVELTQKIRESLSFLFTEYWAHIIPDPTTPLPRSFDFAFVALSLLDMLLRFVSGRDDLRVYVARQNDRNDWRELSLLLASWTEQNVILHRPSYIFLNDLRALLKEHIALLRAVMSKWDVLNERIQSVTRLSLREQWDHVNKPVPKRL